MQRLIPFLCIVASSVFAAEEPIRLDFSPSPLLRFAEKGKQAEAPATAAGACDPLVLTVARPFARPGDRWIEVGVEIDRAVMPLSAVRLCAAVFPIGEPRPAAQQTATPARHAGTLSVDLRSLDLPKARLCVRLLKGEKLVGAAEEFLSARAPTAVLKQGQRVSVLLGLPDGIDKVGAWPVTFGVPFPAGALWDAKRLRLVEGDGREIPCQTEVTGTWSKDGAIKWVRFDASVSSDRQYAVEVAKPGDPIASRVPVRAVEKGGKIVLDTGTARYTLARGRSPIEEIRIGDRRIAAAGPRGLYVMDQTGRVGSASAEDETMAIEASGALAACVRFEGFYKTSDGEQLARHITRVEAFAGQPFARVTHTLVLTNDTNKVWFKDIGWEFSVAPGADPKAIFGVSRSEWLKPHAQPLADGSAAYMLQDKHFFLGHGENHFQLGTLSRGGDAKKVLEGKECGDWAVVQGGNGGLLISCREAARQHPKEFEIHPNRFVFHFFSSRAGEELDFRTETLIKKWDLANWYTRRLRATPQKVAEYLKKVAAYDSNAIGWAKTHHLLIAPVRPKEDVGTVARLSRLHSTPAYALADPAWICASEAMGAIHPKDTKRFPIVERVIEAAFAHEEEMLRKWGDYGFVDYCAGPHYQTGNPRRYGLTYTLRGDLWLTYARSGERKVRDFIVASDRAYMDNRFSHWDGPERVRGLLHSAGGDMWEGYGKGALPFYWEGVSRMETSSTTNLGNFLWQYHLTGYRRAKDVVLEYADGIKRFWTPETVRQSWRSLMAMRMLVQAYGLTWDPELRALAAATTDIFGDREGALGLSKERPYKSSTYKTQVDIAGLLDAWEITGSPRYHDLAGRVSEYWWKNTLGNWPIFYANPQGRIGNFLYRETGDPSYAEGLAVQLRQVASLLDPETGTITKYGRSAGTFIYQGVPYAQQVVVQADADRKPLTSWVGYEEFEDPCSIVIRKGDKDSIALDIKRTDPLAVAASAGGVRLRAVTPGRASGQSLNSLLETSAGVTTVRLPKDSAGGDYEITSSGLGRCFALAHSRVPMVVHAPRYWRPLPLQTPPVRWFFRVPEQAERAQIFFEREALLFDGEGRPAFDGKPVQGWVDLPADQPGLWAFESTAEQLIRVRNLPPFFAARDPDNHFVPDIPWSRAPKGEQEETSPPDNSYVPGAIKTDGNRALFLGTKGTLSLKAEADGKRLLPFHEGSIEFYLKPRWNSLELGTDTSKLLLRMVSAATPWTLRYLRRAKPSTQYPTNNLYAEFYIQGKTKRLRMPAYRPTVLDRDRWVHVAWVWGKRSAATHKGKKELLHTQIFVDGRPGTAYVFKHEELPADEPTALHFGPGLDAAIDELRISDVQRYTTPFAPLDREKEFRVDPHTLALFHFNGDLRGESCRVEGGLPVSLGK